MSGRTMMNRGTPYVVFTELGVDDPSEASPWSSHRLRLLESPRDEMHLSADAEGRRVGRSEGSLETPDSGVIWRLFSPHHRDLACSATALTTLDRAARNARSTVRRAGSLRVEKVTTESGLAFTWFLAINRRPVILANRWWESWRDRDKQLDEVLRFLPEVTVALAPTDPARSRVRAVNALAGFAPPRDEPSGSARRPIAESVRRPLEDRERRRSWQ